MKGENKISILKPSPGSIKDSLEQLTWLDNKISVIAYKAIEMSLGVDTEDDLKIANKIFKEI